MKIHYITFAVLVMLATGCRSQVETIDKAAAPDSSFAMPEGSIDLNSEFAEQNQAWVGKRVRDVFKGRSIKTIIVLDTHLYSAPTSFLTKLVTRLSKSQQIFIKTPPKTDESSPGIFLVHFEDGGYWKIEFYNQHIRIITRNGIAYVLKKEEF